MADTEKREDQKISRCLQEAFGYTDEQLLKQLDQANKTLKDVTFDGAEDRLKKRFLERKAEMEKEEAVSASKIRLREKSAENEGAGDSQETDVKEITLVKSEVESKKEKKIVRFGKKKVLATAALVAVIAGMLGGTAVGKKSYFFRTQRENAAIFLDNDKNKVVTAKIDNAYSRIDTELGIPVLKLGYYPADMSYDDIEVYEDSARITFTYQNKKVYFVQAKKELSTSAMIRSDREKGNSVFNNWIGEEIEYYVNDLENDKRELECLIVKNNCFYYIFGCIPETEFREMLNSLYFF